MPETHPILSLNVCASLSVAFVLAVNSALTKELRTLVAFLTGRFTISAYKEAAHVSSVSNKAVCVCVCVQGVRSQDLVSLILGHSLRNCMR